MSDGECARRFAIHERRRPNAAIYSLFDQILLRPLPVAAPDELVNLKLPGPIQGNDSCNSSGCGDGIIWSYPMLRELERSQTVLAGVAVTGSSARVSPLATNQRLAKGSG